MLRAELTPRIEPSKSGLAQSQSERAADQADADDAYRLHRQMVRPTAGAIRRNLLHQFGVLSGIERLRAVAQRVIGIVVHLHQQPVGAGGHGSARHRRHQIAAAGAVRGIADDRQMRELLHHRNRRDIHRVARVGFESADAALAQNDFVVAAGEDVFGGEQQFFDGGGDAALQQHRLAQLAEFAQQIEILHVARADLQDVGICAAAAESGWHPSLR